MEENVNTLQVDRPKIEQEEQHKKGTSPPSTGPKNYAAEAKTDEHVSGDHDRTAPGIRDSEVPNLGVIGKLRLEGCPYEDDLLQNADPEPNYAPKGKCTDEPGCHDGVCRL